MEVFKLTSRGRFRDCKDRLDEDTYVDLDCMYLSAKKVKIKRRTAEWSFDISASCSIDKYTDIRYVYDIKKSTDYFFLRTEEVASDGGV